MENVHGIAVVGGTFPAVIWRRFAEPALAPLPRRDWPVPRERIDWKRFCGRFQFALTVADARPRVGCPERPERRAPSTTMTPQSVPATTSPQPATTQSPSPPSPPPATTTAPQSPGELVGRRGIAISTIDNAAGTGEVIPSGTEVEVVRADARFVYVAPVPPEGG